MSCHQRKIQQLSLQARQKLALNSVTKKIQVFDRLLISCKTVPSTRVISNNKIKMFILDRTL